MVADYKKEAEPHWCEIPPSTMLGSPDVLSDEQLLCIVRKLRNSIRVIRQFIGNECVYGGVIKMRRNDRVVKVDRYRVIGSRWQLEEDRKTRRS